MKSKQELKEMIEKRNAMAMELKKKLDEDLNKEREGAKKLKEMMERDEKLMRKAKFDLFYIDPNKGQWCLKR
jgi:hypothetical protein